MKKFGLLAMAAAMVSGCKFSHMFGSQIQGSGKVTTVKRTVGTFQAIQLYGALDAEITLGKQSDVSITGDDNLAPLVKTEINGDTLRVSLDGSYSTHNKLTIRVTVPELREAGINGSGDISLHGYTGSDLSLAINGSGDVRADGSVNKLSASIAGSGDLQLFNLKAHDASVSINGSGDAEVNASGQLDGSIAGSGDIRYKGKPTNVGQSIEGSGSIKPAQ